MLKKITFLILSLVLSLPLLAQDEIRSIDLKVNDPEPMVLTDNGFCNLKVSAIKDGESPATVIINIENKNESNTIFLFGFAFDEKTLKKDKIVFDKKSYGTTSRNIIVCGGLGSDQVVEIKPYGNNVLKFNEINGTKTTIELPLYIAKYEEGKIFRKDKYQIRQRVKLILNINLIVPEKKDNELDEIKRRCEDIVDKAELITVCTSKKHKVSEEEQTKEIREEIDALKDDIADIKSENHWRERDEAYKPYKELLATLNGIEFKKDVCDNCRTKPKTRSTSTPTAHSCSYCSKSPSEILVLLQRTYQELDNRKIKKSEALQKIEGIHRAWNGGCPQLKQKVNADSSTKYKVDKYYDAIVKY